MNCGFLSARSRPNDCSARVRVHVHVQPDAQQMERIRASATLESPVSSASRAPNPRDKRAGFLMRAN